MDATPGQKVRRSPTPTKQRVKMYAETAGDDNPSHFDADVARRTEFGGRVRAHAGLTSHRLAADNRWPGAISAPSRRDA